MAPRTILVPIDFANGSDAALAYALEFAKALGSHLVVRHVTSRIPVLTVRRGCGEAA